ncbi:uncharacterized protein LOC117576179 isoform X4 [Drosophila albomicans]|uniref:Uncharacterized protein LOC117576179 isoform X4 n=1 Tax=Drosophila albomicans TaxID=7291 RepID=A0A9C6WCN6_DROAB|nr:uncharacterized protein LOC117576179 isoform X4 [Drosophila albomicans]
MVAHSKIFELPLCRMNCASVIHALPYQTCTEAYIWNIYRNHVASGKYYFPLLLLPLLMQCNKLNRKRVWSAVRNYLETSSVGAMINATNYYLVCIFRKLNGRFVWAFTPFISTFLGAQLIWLAPPKVVQFYCTGIVHSSLETILRQLNFGVVHSHLTRTLVFMLCSIIVLRGQQAHGYSDFWFIKPKQLPQDYRERSIEQRIKDGLLELRAYLGFGLGMDLFNAVVNRKMGKFNMKSTRFLVSYMGIYKVLQCLLIDHMDVKHTNLLAAFLSGGAFWFVRQIPLTLMSFAVVVATQVLWKEFCATDASKSQLRSGLQCIPWAKLLIPPNLAYLTHINFFQRAKVSKLAMSFIENTCEFNDLRISNMLSLSTEEIMDIFSKLPKRPFLF